MTSKQKQAAKEYAVMVKQLAARLNDVRMKLEEIAGDAFLDASCEGRANDEEVRLFDGGNNRLNEVEHTLREALCFYGELLGENFGEEKAESGDDRRAALPKNSPTVGDKTTSPRPAVRRQRGEEGKIAARCETCKFCAFPRTTDDNGGACKCKLMRRKTIDVLVTGGAAPVWCPLTERGVKA